MVKKVFWKNNNGNWSLIFIKKISEKKILAEKNWCVWKGVKKLTSKTHVGSLTFHIFTKILMLDYLLSIRTTFSAGECSPLINSGLWNQAFLSEKSFSWKKISSWPSLYKNQMPSWGKKNYSSLMVSFFNSTRCFSSTRCVSSTRWFSFVFIIFKFQISNGVVLLQVNCKLFEYLFIFIFINFSESQSAKITVLLPPF